MREYCTECGGTGKKKLGDTLEPVVCLHCEGSGIEPRVTDPVRRHIVGPLHTYPGLKRDAMILVGLVILAVVFRMTCG